MDRAWMMDDGFPLAIAVPAGDREASAATSSETVRRLPSPSLAYFVCGCVQKLSPQTNYHDYPTFFPLRNPKYVFYVCSTATALRTTNLARKDPVISFRASTLPPSHNQDPSGPWSNLESSLLSVSDTSLPASAVKRWSVPKSTCTIYPCPLAPINKSAPSQEKISHTSKAGPISSRPMI